MLPKDVGPCRASVKKFYFNTETAVCEEFRYGGCNGNDNNFDSFTDCHSVCGSKFLCCLR